MKAINLGLVLLLAVAIDVWSHRTVWPLTGTIVRASNSTRIFSGHAQVQPCHFIAGHDLTILGQWKLIGFPLKRNDQTLARGVIGHIPVIWTE